MNLTEKGRERLRLIWGILTSCLLVLSGILFISACYSIYKSGYSPFTRESIAEAFSEIAVFVYITLFAVVGGFVIAICFPKKEKKLSGKRTNSIVMKKLYSSVNLADLDEDTRLGIEKEEKLRRIMLTVNIVLFVLSGILPLIYLLNPNNFPAETGKYNSEIMRGMLFYLICLSPVFIYEMIYVAIYDRSVLREIAMLRKTRVVTPFEASKNDAKCGGVLSKTRDFFTENSKPIVLGMRIAFVGCAIGFIVAGVINGGAADVLQKAIKICTECIGLG